MTLLATLSRIGRVWSGWSMSRWYICLWCCLHVICTPHTHRCEDLSGTSCWLRVCLGGYSTDMWWVRKLQIVLAMWKRKILSQMQIVAPSLFDSYGGSAFPGVGDILYSIEVKEWWLWSSWLQRSTGCLEGVILHWSLGGWNWQRRAHSSGESSEEACLRHYDTRGQGYPTPQTNGSHIIESASDSLGVQSGPPQVE